jgi:hypothetical protein
MEDSSRPQTKMTVGEPDAVCTPGMEDEVRQWKRNPVVLALIIVASVFTAEVLVMVGLSFISPPAWYAVPFLDALVLSLLAFPVVYLLFSRLVTEYLTRCEGYKAERKRLLEELEEARRKLKELGG